MRAARIALLSTVCVLSLGGFAIAQTATSPAMPPQEDVVLPVMPKGEEAPPPGFYLRVVTEPKEPHPLPGDDVPVHHAVPQSVLPSLPTMGAARLKVDHCELLPRHFSGWRSDADMRAYLKVYCGIE